jgi:hypothetical protein
VRLASCARPAHRTLLACTKPDRHARRVRHALHQRDTPQPDAPYALHALNQRDTPQPDAPYALHALNQRDTPQPDAASGTRCTP